MYAVHGVRDADLNVVSRGRVHHLGVRNAVAEAAGNDCFGVLEFFENRLELRGYGGLKSLTLSCPTVEAAKALIAHEEAAALLLEKQAKTQRQEETFDLRLAADAKLALDMQVCKLRELSKFGRISYMAHVENVVTKF